MRFKLKKTGNEYILALAINIALFLIFILLFEPTAKSDDYDMMLVLYGGWNGEYSPFLLYSNPLYGMFLSALMRLMPAVPWYFVIQYALMLWGMTEVTGIFLKKSGIPAWLVIFLLAFVYYECFIRITFTKTAGLLVICGLLTLFYLIDTYDRFSFRYLEGIILIAMGGLIRSATLRLCLLTFAGGFIVFALDRIRQRSGMPVEERNRKLIQKTAIFASLALLIFVYASLLPQIERRFFNSDRIWGNYYSDNISRGVLFDYGIPDYNTYRSEYEKLGISATDYTMWFTKAWRDDQDLLSFEKMAQIRAIANHSVQVDTADKFYSARRGSIAWCFNNTMFYFFLCASVLSLMTCKGKKAAYAVPIVLLSCLIPYYYLSVTGRVTHHVDAVIFIAGAFLVMYHTDHGNDFAHRSSSAVMMIAVIALCFVQVYNAELRSSSYYGTTYGTVPSQSKQYALNKEDMDLLSDDREHLYLFNPHDTNTTYPAFTVWEVIPRNYYHNIHRMNMDHIPIHKNVLSDFGVENPLKEIADSNTMFYYVSNSRIRQKDADAVLNYVKENYNENAVRLAVKSLENGKIYRIYSEDLTVDDSELLDRKNLDYKVSRTYSKAKGRLTISGHAFEEGTDSFAQNIYIKAVNTVDGTVRYYPTVQKKYAKMEGEDKYHGAYSAFSQFVEMEREQVAQTVFSVLLENSSGVYEIPVKKYP